MPVIELLCPHCSIRLRFRDHSFVGRTVRCPECSEALRVEQVAGGELVGIAVDSALLTDEASTTHGQSTSSKLTPEAKSGGQTPETSPPATTVRDWLTPSWWTPGRIAAGVAALLTVAGVLLVLWGSDRGQPETIADPSQATPPAGKVDNPAAAPPEVSGEPLPPVVVAAPPEIDLKPLSDLLIAFRERQGRFPGEPVAGRELPEQERLGWIAEVISTQDPSGPQPQWDRSLLDPLNSRFVRRRQPALLNPLITEAAVDGLPATHFVGIAGVGRDAPRLPVTHPRAGIFGEHRITTVAEVRDGLSHTLMIAGTNVPAGPWAAGGGRTIRPLTEAPYINGPDGFGTAQSQGMTVLMADGSVRFLAKEIDPVVMRRMAAIADGLPLDPAVPGEPGEIPPQLANGPMTDSTPPVNPVPTQVPDPGPSSPPKPPQAGEAPLLPELANSPPPEPKPTYNIERALGLPIVRFSQARPVRLREMLVQLEELAGIPIRLDKEANPALLDRELTLDLASSTVGEILSTLAGKFDLSVTSDPGEGIRLAPAAQN